MPHEFVNNNDTPAGGKQHLFHLVDPSPWPILTSFALLTLAIGGVMFMHDHLLGKYIYN